MAHRLRLPEPWGYPGEMMFPHQYSSWAAMSPHLLHSSLCHYDHRQQLSRNESIQHLLLERALTGLTWRLMIETEWSQSSMTTYFSLIFLLFFVIYYSTTQNCINNRPNVLF